MKIIIVRGRYVSSLFISNSCMHVNSCKYCHDFVGDTCSISLNLVFGLENLGKLPLFLRHLVSEVLLERIKRSTREPRADLVRLVERPAEADR